MQQLDAEAVGVVDVDHRPGSEAQRRAVRLEARLLAAPVGGLEVAPVAKPEGDVEQPLVADPVAVRPRPPARLGVLDQLDEEVVGPQQRRVAPRALEAPQRLVLGAVQGKLARRLEAQHALEDVARALQRRHRERDAARRHGRIGARALAPSRAPSGRPPSARRARHRGRARRRGARPRRRSARSAARCRPPRARPSAASRSATWTPSIE